VARPKVKKHNCIVCLCPLTLIGGDKRVMCLRCKDERKVIPIVLTRPPAQRLEDEAQQWYERAVRSALASRKKKEGAA